jgi:hypothetical protein
MPVEPVDPYIVPPPPPEQTTAEGSVREEEPPPPEPESQAEAARIVEEGTAQNIDLLA